MKTSDIRISKDATNAEIASWARKQMARLGRPAPDFANDARRAAGTIDGGAAYAAAYAAWNTWEALGARLRAAEMRLGLPATY